MNGSRGKRHGYLVMWLDYSVFGVVRIYMEEYLKGVLGNFSEEITEISETPTAKNLFTIRDENDIFSMKHGHRRSITQWRSCSSLVFGEVRPFIRK